jgi:hypothetical protein
MPARSVAQRRLMAIAEHHPAEVNAKNRGVLSMSKGQLHDFARTSERGLPSVVGKATKHLMKAREVRRRRK